MSKFETTRRAGLIGFDRDGTLVSPEWPVTDALRVRLSTLSARGHGLFLASGRGLPFLRTFARSLGVKFVALAAENGGHIQIGNRELRPANSPDLEAFRQAVASVVLPASVPESKISVWTRQFGAAAAEAAAILSELVRANGWALAVLAHPDGGVDVTPLSQDKQAVLDHLPTGGCPVAYFGDNHNDLGIMSDPRVIPNTLANGAAAVKDLVRARGGRIATRPCGEGVVELLDELFPRPATVR